MEKDRFEMSEDNVSDSDHVNALREFVRKEAASFDVLKLKVWEFQFLQNYLSDSQKKKFRDHHGLKDGEI